VKEEEEEVNKKSELESKKDYLKVLRNFMKPIDTVDMEKH
jgi:hypothetical protein